MGRLIVFILICGFFLVFIVFNLEHKSDISFGFKTFKDIPVFLTCFSSFLLGMLFAVPFVLSFGKGRKKPNQPGGSPPSPSAIKKWWGKKSEKTQQEAGSNKSSEFSVADAIRKEDSSYGID